MKPTFDASMTTASLYCLVDAPSDSGATYTRGGQNYTGDAAFSFDRDMDGLNRIDPADLAFDITASGNKTLLSFIYNEPAWSSQVNAATTRCITSFKQPT